MCVQWLSYVQFFATVACQAPLYWKSPGKNTAVGSHSLLQGIFLIQRLNLRLLHCQQILYHLNCQGSLTLNEVPLY